MTKTARHFHWRGENTSSGQVANFGDLLGPLLLKRFSGVSSEWSAFKDANIVTVGSVLQLMPGNWHGTVAGAGKLREDSPFAYGPQTQILALRGPLTARGIPGSFALGDPGLLAPELLAQLPAKEHALGILPHWSDKALASRPEFLRYDPLIIRPDEDPLEVIRKIGSCRKLVTSSLHGAIVADAFCIPRRVEGMWLTKIDSWFKWRDYHASVKMQFEPGVTATPKRQHVEDLTYGVWDVFRELGGKL